MVRHLVLALVSSLLCAAQLVAQETGTIIGRVVDGTTQQPIAGATVVLVGMQRGTLTQADGAFLITGVPVGVHRVRAALIGYAAQQQTVEVSAGATATAQFALQPEAVLLEEVVAVGYGTQRREAITGSIATLNADQANVGVISNANEMIQGRLTGVEITPTNGEPGAGTQVRIRGGTSISGGNEPLYVIDGVPVQNIPAEAGGFSIGGRTPAPARNPLNLINPSDIASITILKDASAAAIYGARAANGVVLIETKKGSTAPGGGVTIEYDGYVSTASPARELEVLNGAEYRAFIQDQVNKGKLPQAALASLGDANTNWEDEVTRSATTHNHNLSFTGGSESTRYRASLNYMNQKGVVLSNGFERIQGRINGMHSAWDNRLRLGLNLTASHVINDYLLYENTGGFEGGVFQNMVQFNPTRPIRDPDTGQFFEEGTGRQSVRNPVAMAEQVDDIGQTTRSLGNAYAELDLWPNLTGRINVGLDRSEGLRRFYLPRLSPVGAEFGGLAQQTNRDNTAVILQTLVTFRQQFGELNGLEIVGGYEYNDYELGEFRAEGRDFLADAFSFNNLGAGKDDFISSFREESRLVSFFSRANLSLSDKYYLTGVLRRDGSSRFGKENKWATFPAVSASWRLSQEAFLRESPLFSDLRLRAGWGKQGNEAVPPYSSLILLASSGKYPIGEQPAVGVAPVTNPNPDLKWEETTQINVALDYGLFDNRFTGSIEYYTKETEDLLLVVDVVQPAPAGRRLENIGKVRNRGLELSLDAQVLNRPNMSWMAGLVFATERNEVKSLGGRTFLNTGDVSGQGQSGQVVQRLIPGEPLGTFYGPVFVGVDDQGRQLFKCTTAADKPDCVNGQSLVPIAEDFEIIGDANPDFTFGVRSQLNWGKFDVSFLVRGEIGQDVFNNTALVYGTKSNGLQNKNFLKDALNDPDDIRQPAIVSSRWVEDGSFVRLQNVTVGYTFDLPMLMQARRARIYVSGDNLLLATDYSGYDPEVHTEASIDGLAVRGIDYLVYPRPRTLTAGIRLSF